MDPAAGAGRGGLATLALARPREPEGAESPEALRVVGDGEEAPRRLPRRQDLRQPVQHLQPQRVCLSDEGFEGGEVGDGE